MGSLYFKVRRLEKLCVTMQTNFDSKVASLESALAAERAARRSLEDEVVCLRMASANNGK